MRPSLAAALALALAAGLSCTRRPEPPAHGTRAAKDSLFADAQAQCERLLAEPGAREAGAWLRESRAEAEHVLCEMDPARSRRLVDDLYGLGAKRVTAADIQRESPEDPSEFTCTLVVEPGADAEARARFFAWEADFARGLGAEGDRDEGERYVLLYFK
jgi:hypothetical protein